MKLLICTQIVDPNDSDLGFFVQWIEEFKKHCEVEVISLQTLGSGGRLARAWRLLRLVSQLDYDAVFVHMNPEYLVVAGWWWRLTGKKTALWYTHKSVNLKLRIAVLFANVAFTASPESFRLRTKKVRVMGHGIDTDFFTPDPGVRRGTEVLAAGRLTKSKRHDVAIRAMQFTHRELWIAGEGPERSPLEALARKLGVASRVHFLGGRTQEELRALYHRAGVMVHTSETGSLDKVVLEALACGCPVVTTSRSLGGVPALVAGPEPKALAAALEHPSAADPAWVRAHHSLASLIPRILKELAHD